MPSDETSGLFFCPMLKPHGEPAGPAFCKPHRIAIYSAPPPVRMRVVIYEMMYWPGNEQPEGEQFNQYKRYRSGATGQYTFSFTTGTAPMDIQMHLLPEIRRHFCSTEVRGKQVRDKNNALGRFHDQNEATNSSLDREGIRTQVQDVFHCERIPVNEEGEHVLGDQKIFYRAFYEEPGKGKLATFNYQGKYLTIKDVEYEDNRRLIHLALNDASRVTKRDQVIRYFQT